LYQCARVSRIDGFECNYQTHVWFNCAKVSRVVCLEYTQLHSRVVGVVLLLLVVVVAVVVVVVVVAAVVVVIVVA